MIVVGVLAGVGFGDGVDVYVDFGVESDPTPLKPTRQSSSNN